MTRCACPPPPLTWSLRLSVNAGNGSQSTGIPQASQGSGTNEAIRSVEDSVYVYREFQGKGVGTKLLQEIVVRALKLGYHTVIAGVVPPNQASVRLHEGRGFVHIGNFREVGLVLKVARRWLLPAPFAIQRKSETDQPRVHGVSYDAKAH